MCVVLECNPRPNNPYGALWVSQPFEAVQFYRGVLMVGGFVGAKYHQPEESIDVLLQGPLTGAASAAHLAQWDRVHVIPESEVQDWVGRRVEARDRWPMEVLGTIPERRVEAEPGDGACDESGPSLVAPERSNQTTCRCGGWFGKDKKSVAAGYAVLTENGERICYECSYRLHLQEMRTQEAISAYVSGDGKALTTWTGRVLAQAVDRNHCKLTRASHTHSQEEYSSFWFLDPTGQRWYGRGSPGMLIRVRKVAQ